MGRLICDCFACTRSSYSHKQFINSCSKPVTQTDEASFDYEPRDWLDITITHGRGFDVIHDPVINKGTGFP